MAQIAVLGNAVVDGFCHVDDSILEKFNLIKGDYGHIPHQDFMALNDDVMIEHFAAGGSAANVAWTLQALGHDVTFFGKVGQDPAGKHFFQDMQEAGVAMQAPADDCRTFQIFVLITPDGKRTFVEPKTTALITPDWLDRDKLQSADWLLIEGYTLLDQFETVQHAITAAKSAATRILLTLAPPQLLQRARQNFATVIASGVDLIVSDTPEATAMLGLLPDAAQVVFHNTNRIQTASGDGATFYTPHANAVYAPTEKIDAPKDTTGAGDNFAAGFLHGMLTGKDPMAAMSMGHGLAGEVLKTVGARLMPEALKTLV